LEFDENGHFISATVSTKDGLDILLRAAVSEDKEGLEMMFRACSSETLYTRFLSPGLGVPLRYIDRLMKHSPPDDMSIIAEVSENGGGSIIALMNFVKTDKEKNAEIAIVVRDDFQNRGLGTSMLNCLSDIAKSYRINKIVADIDAGNRRVFHLIQRSGFPSEINIKSGVAHAEVNINERPGIK
jgi:RimJ/RimL family protein N-acetyltransferase